LDIFKPKRRRCSGWISLRLVKLVSVDAGRGSPRSSVTPSSVAEDAVLDGNITNLDAVVDAVQGLEENGDAHEKSRLALPTAAVITKKILVPAGARDEELEVQVESEPIIHPVCAREVNLDFQVVGPSPSDRTRSIADRRLTQGKGRRPRRGAEASASKAIVMDVESRHQGSFELIQSASRITAKTRTSRWSIGRELMNVTGAAQEQTVYTREQRSVGSQLTQDIIARVRHELRKPKRRSTSGVLPTAPKRLRPSLPQASCVHAHDVLRELNAGRTPARALTSVVAQHRDRS